MGVREGPLTLYPMLKSEKIGREVYFWPDADTVRQALEAVKEYVREH